MAAIASAWPVTVTHTWPGPRGPSVVAALGGVSIKTARQWYNNMDAMGWSSAFTPGQFSVVAGAKQEKELDVGSSRVAVGTFGSEALLPDVLPAIGGEAVETHEPRKNTKCLQDELRHYALPDQGHTECPPGEPLSAALPPFKRSLVISCDYASFCKSSQWRWHSLGHFFRDKQVTTRDPNLFGLEFLETTEFGSNRAFGHIKPIPHSGARANLRSTKLHGKEHEQHKLIFARLGSWASHRVSPK